MDRWRGTRASRLVVGPRAGPAATPDAALAVRVVLALAERAVRAPAVRPAVAAPTQVAVHLMPAVAAARPADAAVLADGRRADAALVDGPRVGSARAAANDRAVDPRQAATAQVATGRQVEAPGLVRAAVGRGPEVTVRQAAGVLTVRARMGVGLVLAVTAQAVAGRAARPREEPVMARLAAGPAPRVRAAGLALPVTARAVAGLAPRHRAAPVTDRAVDVQATAREQVHRGQLLVVPGPAIPAQVGGRVAVPVVPPGAARLVTATQVGRAAPGMVQRPDGQVGRARRPRQVGRSGTGRDITGHRGLMAEDRLGRIAKSNPVTGGKRAPAGG